MPRAIYVPVFDRFFESSIMREDLSVRFVMLALIRLAWRSGADGIVDVDPVIFAGSINIPPDDVDRALKRLMEPDPCSASPNEDGRRIVPLDPERPMRGWKLVNWQRYRDLIRQINDAGRKQREYHAAKDNTESSKVSENLRKPPPVSDFLDTIRDDTIRDDTNIVGASRPQSIDEVKTYWTEKGLAGDPEAFWGHFEEREWHAKGEKSPMKDWRRAARGWSRREGSGPSSMGRSPARPSLEGLAPRAPTAIPSWDEMPEGIRMIHKRLYDRTATDEEANLYSAWREEWERALKVRP